MPNNTSWNRKPYDKQRAVRLYQEFKERKSKLIFDVMGGKCALCEKLAQQNFHLHHVIYDQESNYPRHSKNMWVRQKRLKEAEKNPDKFKLLCPQCHLKISSFNCIVEKFTLEKVLSLLPRTI